jgi:hypothetical protein
MLLEGALQLREGLLRARQVSGLKRLTNSREILVPLADFEGIPVGEWAAFAHGFDSVEFLLGAGKISGLERLAKLLQIRIPRVKVSLQLLVNRTCGNCCR